MVTSVKSRTRQEPLTGTGSRAGLAWATAELGNRLHKIRKSSVGARGSKSVVSPDGDCAYRHVCLRTLTVHFEHILLCVSHSSIKMASIVKKKTQKKT